SPSVIKGFDRYSAPLTNLANNSLYSFSSSLIVLDLVLYESLHPAFEQIVKLSHSDISPLSYDGCDQLPCRNAYSLLLLQLFIMPEELYHICILFYFP